MNRCATLICIQSHCNKITYESLVRAWNGGELLILWVKHLLSSLQAVCILNCSANVIKCFICHYTCIQHHLNVPQITQYIQQQLYSIIFILHVGSPIDRPGFHRLLLCERSPDVVRPSRGLGSEQMVTGPSGAWLR